jgi:ankyrin repeat protein
MGCRIERLGGWWLVSLLSAGSLVAASGDLRLVEAVKIGDKEAVRSLLQEHADVNAPQGDGATALAWAAHRNDLETAELLIRAGANVNAANDYGVTPLSLACTNRDAAMVEKLLQAGANPNAAQWTGETVLMTCARAGNADAVKLLLARGADVNGETRRGQTALMWAVAQRRPAVARMLIERGADVNAKSHTLEGFTPLLHVTYGLYDHVPGQFDKFDATGGHHDPTSSKGGFTPLLFAARVGDLDSARILLAAGANVNEVALENGSALVVASANGHEALAIFLLDKGADPNVTDGYGFTALHYALRQGITAIGMSRTRIPTDAVWLRPNMPELVKALLVHGANPNARAVKGFPPYNYPPFARADINPMPHIRQPGATPFLLAAAAGDARLMRLLLASGADPLLTTEERTTALMVAAGLGKVEDLTEQEEESALEAAKLALELGVDVNAANRDGRTALHGAASLGANTIIQFLVEKGAELDPKDKYGVTPLIIAAGEAGRLVARGDRRFRLANRSHKSTADLLLRLGAIPLPAPAAARSDP